MFEFRRQSSGDKGYIWLLLLVLLPVMCFGEFRDPTQPPSQTIELVPATVAADKLHLSAIWISSESRRASINGVMAKQGQTILNNVKILKIRKNSVDLMQNGKPETLELLKRPYTIPQ